MQSMRCVGRTGVVLGLSLVALLRQQDGLALDIAGPPNSQAFGSAVKALPNGNIVVTDPSYAPEGFSVGAVYLYSPSGALISTLTGATPGDYVGNGGITVLANGSFVVCSPYWRNSGSNQYVGAATWVDGAMGLNGTVSAANSLVGSQDSDYVCESGVTALKNGNYVVSSEFWKSAERYTIGAATWCSGNGGCVGAVSLQNSLTGVTPGDNVSSDGTVALNNGNYVVASSFWNNAAASRAGAVTLCNGDTGCVGAVSPDNSLVGGSSNDNIGNRPSPGNPSVVALTSGNYVVLSANAMGNVGAVTWVNGAAGLIDKVSAANSLVGSTAGDLSGAAITALKGDAYVVSSPSWSGGGASNVGAATWCNGTCTGTVGSDISLVGSAANDRVGFTPAVALDDGNYVVISPFWSNLGVPELGAATWCDGQVGCRGPLVATNSLVGTSAYDIVGSAGVAALRDGRYIVASPYWTNSSAGVTAAGAVTWCDGSKSCVGAEITPSNSLIGTAQNDEVGWGIPGVYALSSGNYVVYSNHWLDSGALVGAVTWGNGSAAPASAISPSNSFIGTAANDGLGGTHLFAVANGSYIVHSPSWPNDSANGPGAVTLLRGCGMQTGTIDSSNSVEGTVAYEGPLLSYDYDVPTDELIVGKPKENVVTLLRVDQLFFNGFD